MTARVQGNSVTQRGDVRWSWNSYPGRLLAATYVSGVGSGITGLAVLQLAQLHFGSASIPLLFMFGILPPLILPTTSLLKRFTNQLLLPIWVGLQIASAGCVLLYIAAAHNFAVLLTVYAIESFGYFMASVILRSVTSEAVPDESKHRLYRLQAGAFSVKSVIAPSLGALIAAYWGFSLVFILDAATFLFAAAVLWPVRASLARPSMGELPVASPSAAGAAARILSNSHARRVLLFWFLWTSVFAVVNMAEIPLANTNLHLGTRWVGFFLTAAACGGLAATLSASFLPRLHVPYAAQCVLAGSAVLMLAVGSVVVAFCGMILYGFVFNELVASRRLAADAILTRENLPNLRFWSLYQKSALLGNVWIYMVGVIAFGINISPRLVLGAGVALLMVIGAGEFLAKKDVLRPRT